MTRIDLQELSELRHSRVESLLLLVFRVGRQDRPRAVAGDLVLLLLVFDVGEQDRPHQGATGDPAVRVTSDVLRGGLTERRECRCTLGLIGPPPAILRDRGTGEVDVLVGGLQCRRLSVEVIRLIEKSNPGTIIAAPGLTPDVVRATEGEGSERDQVRRRRRFPAEVAVDDRARRLDVVDGDQILDEPTRDLPALRDRSTRSFAFPKEPGLMGNGLGDEIPADVGRGDEGVHVTGEITFRLDRLGERRSRRRELIRIGLSSICCIEFELADRHQQSRETQTEPHPHSILEVPVQRLAERGDRGLQNPCGLPVPLLPRLVRASRERGRRDDDLRIGAVELKHPLEDPARFGPTRGADIHRELPAFQFRNACPGDLVETGLAQDRTRTRCDVLRRPDHVLTSDRRLAQKLHQRHRVPEVRRREFEPTTTLRDRGGVVAGPHFLKQPEVEECGRLATRTPRSAKHGKNLLHPPLRQQR